MDASKLERRIRKGIDLGLCYAGQVPLFRLVNNRIRLAMHAKDPERKLEIGPGAERLPGFETINIVAGLNTDYVADVANRLPFPDDTFSLIYTSHVLEHIPWPDVPEVLREWKRVLCPGGALEVWVPDGVKICKLWLDYELEGINRTGEDPWYKFNPDKDPCRWANARLLRFGQGPGGVRESNWHHAFFSPRFLCKVLQEAGLVDVRLMERSEVRGVDHGWINLGARGIKP